ncbi:pirin family protein [Actinopolyspora mortivallis]|uniref:Pirin n=1 Tax=Actinopolyspora mortivallis TaxID=33906 RepID=A0A2T0GX53_ACTMO|nr:pirin family protein [Actinopolyspora mortivallis]PRW63603.1 pirin [Actinopolyspora mortivallis]
MSNLETAPAELTCTNTEDQAGRARLLRPREVPLGGPRAMTVRRTLPQRQRSLIGAWCFVDHYGPDDVATTGGMRVPGHPHTGLQTVSWLFDGEVEHRDTLGTHALVRPGELNLMTAGSGIAHSEHSTADTRVLRGAQLWVALPERHRLTDPAFDSYAPPPLERDGTRVSVFLGSLLGRSSPVSTYTPLLGAEITLRPGRELTLEVDPTFEHGVLVDTGAVTVAGVRARAGELVCRDTGPDRLTLEAAPGEPARMLLLGGSPLGERIVMWWNFVGGDHEEIAAHRRRWQYEREHPGTGQARQYGRFPAQWTETLPAPELPHVRLKPRE